MSHDHDPAAPSTPDEPGEPVFASPTPPAALPAGGPSDVHLPDAAGPPGADPSSRPAGADGRPGRRPAARRRALLGVGAVVAVALVAGGVALGVDAARSRAWAPVSADVAQAREVGAVQLVLGSCVAELPADGPVERVTVVPCDEPHQAQVVGRTDAAPDAVWPGEADAGAKARTSCTPSLLGAQGRTEADALRFVVWAPSEASWEAGDRTSLCLAGSDTTRSGSLLV